MTSYGYRLFTLKIFEGMKRTALEFDHKRADGSPFSYRNHLIKGTSNFVNGIHPGWPPNKDGTQASDRYGGTAFELLTLCESPVHLAGKFRFGRESGHETAYPLDQEDSGEPVDIEGAAVARSYRFLILLPSSGTEGIVAVEAVGGACPYKPLERWFRYWSQRYAVSISNDEPYYRAKLTPLFEGSQISKLLKKSQAEEVVLTFKKTGASGRQTTHTMRLKAELSAVSSRQAKKALETAIVQDTGDEGLSDDLASLLGSNVDGIGFDDAWVVMNFDDYGQRRVSPSRIPEVFTYIIGEKRPDEIEFQTRVQDRIMKLRSHPAAATIDLQAWPKGVDDDRDNGSV